MDTTTERTYLVCRYGSNAANQGTIQRQIVGTVKAATLAAARKIVADGWADKHGTTVYANQHLRAERLCRRDHEELDDFRRTAQVNAELRRELDKTADY